VGDNEERNGLRYTVLRASARRAERIEVRRVIPSKLPEPLESSPGA
jgi:hypothetical protein